jgi:hypothetical protein
MERFIGTVIWLDDKKYATLKQPYLYVKKDTVFHMLPKYVNSDSSEFLDFDGKSVEIEGMTSKDGKYINVHFIEEFKGNII